MITILYPLYALIEQMMTNKLFQLMLIIQTLSFLVKVHPVLTNIEGSAFQDNSGNSSHYLP